MPKAVARAMRGIECIFLIFFRLEILALTIITPMQIYIILYRNGNCEVTQYNLKDFNQRIKC
jgi:hypothetical protein